jgi:hypothetical protein
MPTGTFTVNARFVTTRSKHHRIRDHFGADTDLNVGLSQRVGPWEEGTPLYYVIEDLWARLAVIELGGYVLGSFTCDSVLLSAGGWIESPAGTFRSTALLDAVLKKTISSSFTAGAVMTRGGSFTADASIRGAGTFTASAVFVHA